MLHVETEGAFSRAPALFTSSDENSVLFPLYTLAGQFGWSAVGHGVREARELMKINGGSGPFVLGAGPSYRDFFIAGWFQAARAVDEGVFQKTVAFPGFKEVHEGCLPFMRKVCSAR